MEDTKTTTAEAAIIIEPMELNRLFKKLMACARELDSMDLLFSDHPKMRNLMKDHFPQFMATPQEDMPDKDEWKRIFFRGTLVISSKQHGQLPEEEWQKRSLLITFWNDHSVTAIPVQNKNNGFFDFPEWKEESYTDFFRVLERYLKEQKCFRKKKLVA